ncbi:MAG TPA: septum formation initiator family protein [Anaerolineaceae bacterium]|nr:septum formation initiator family protein [Anaerolineaceae bacterium]
MKKLFANKKQILVVALLVVSFFLVMDLNSRLNDLFRLSSQRDQLQNQVSQLQATQSNLQTRIAYATSEAAVKDWAREYAGMGQAGDIPVIPLSPKDYTPAAPVVETPTQQVVDHWQKWWALFFGN